MELNPSIANDFLNIDIGAEISKKSHLKFIEYCWQKSSSFIIGYHTRKICDEIDNVINEYDRGKSCFLIIKVPFRHGKSDIISRYLPPHFLGRFPESEVLVATYGQDLSNDLSRFSRSIIQSDQYKKIYPEIKLSPHSYSIQNWKLDNLKGSTHWVGVGGGITGRGYHLGIIDDYLKNREDAESQLIRDKQWAWFTDVFMTRAAPVSITVILATPWHVDDLIGRIEKEMGENKDFPDFKIITLPAISENYKNKYLFLERFSELWYKQKMAVLGSYGIASLLQCNPVLRGGNLLKTDNIKILSQEEFPKDLNFVRGWDLASSEKQRLKKDPDYTAGVLATVILEKKEDIDIKIPKLYIKHVTRMRAEAPKRNKKIIQTVKLDISHNCFRMGVETVAGYKDTHTIMKDILSGIIHVENINVSRDKLSRASALEPIFEAGNVYLLEGEWNQMFIDECAAFPNGDHDDMVDALICCWEMLKGGELMEVTVTAKNPDIPEKKEIAVGNDMRSQFDGNSRKNLI
jgi:predicted phage terminase large subunit-like protein